VKARLNPQPNRVVILKQKESRHPERSEGSPYLSLLVFVVACFRRHSRTPLLPQRRSLLEVVILNGVKDPRIGRCLFYAVAVVCF
jgi:hypothetical protein